jgi:stearoyl-CoA desaturase (delta-9 desaturase)
VNSICHKFGYRTYATDDYSTNCWWVAFLTFGEGWHNNHHACQSSAQYGRQWWEIDLVWLMIRLLQRLGLATKVRVLQKL